MDLEDFLQISDKVKKELVNNLKNNSENVDQTTETLMEPIISISCKVVAKMLYEYDKAKNNLE